MNMDVLYQKFCYSLVSVTLVMMLCSFVSSTEIDLTIDIPAGRQECFWQTIPASTSCELDYQVIDGGDMDISLMIAGPDGRAHHMEQQKNENVVKFSSEQAGDYKICFDNTFSTFSNKVVFFELFIEDGKDDGIDDGVEGHQAMRDDLKTMQQELDITVEEFVGILDRSKKHLERSVQVQTLIRVHEAKDRNTQEANFWRVNFFSFFQLIVMGAVSLCQVYMIRGLFQDNKPVSGSTVKQRT